MDFALNNLQRSIYHKTQTTNNYIYLYIYEKEVNEFIKIPSENLHFYFFILCEKFAEK